MAATSAPVFDTRLKQMSVVVILGSVMSILDTTIVVVGIDRLSQDFHATLSSIQWVTTGYLLALSLVIPLAGWAVERFGAKRVYLLSLMLFLAGSALCGAAWSTGSLIAFRVLQGFGGGLIMPVGMTILATEAGPQRLGRVMSFLGVPTLLGPILGPVIGGLIVSNISWRWMFYVNVPVGALALLAAFRFLPKEPPVGAERLDWFGLALLSPGLASLLYGLSEAANSGGVTSPRVLTGVAVGLALLGAFALRSLRAASPVVDLRLYSHRSFSVANLTSVVIGAALFGGMFLLPLYYQIVRGQSALDAGLLMAPQGLGAMITMRPSGRIVDQRGPRDVVLAGLLILMLGTTAYAFVGNQTNEAWLAGSLFVRGLGLGLAMMPAFTAAYLTLDRQDVPRATTLMNIVQRVGGSLGTAVVAVLLQRGIEHRLGGNLSSIAAGIHSAHGSALAAQAFANTFGWTLAFSGLSLIPAFFLPSRPVGRQLPAPTEAAAEVASVAPAGSGAPTAGVASEAAPG